MTDTDLNDSFDTDIAVVGMAGRFAGARNLGEYWKNLRDGVESIQSFTDEQLLAAGVDPAELADPNYVKSGAVLPNMEMFDAPFFGFSPREASVMDPQHRHFLECAWEALEDAGHVPEAFNGAIGVFGGSGHNAYMPYNLLTNPKLMASMGFFLVRHTGNDKDFLTTRVSYLLNLKGPSVNVQTACSTSLVAIHMGVQSLLARECDMVLAGGVTIELPHRQGYLYREGEILSPDGHCHAFDAGSQGTVFGSGVGVVVLRRLADALADGDHIHAVIKGSAVNNDGAMKVGYLAPSVDGQAQSIAEALAVAGVTPDSISYVETHGTGTPVGDPIEIAALTQAFRQGTDKVGFCGVGSVKSNIGHTDTAAGVASFIKVALAMQHRQLPPSLHFEQPNPACEFETSPFYVNAALKVWSAAGGPRRAGVSSLGVGGTNAHIILEEAPPPTSDPASRPLQLLVMSAKTTTALDAGASALADHLAAEPELELADAAWTLQVGREAMKHRRFVVAGSGGDAAQALRSADAQRVVTLPGADAPRTVAFMFAGGGAQYPAMGADLYRSESVFRAAVDECLALLQRFSKVDFRSLLFPADGSEAQAAKLLERPSHALPALFTVQYAQARLWMSWGLEPAAMIGHSMGEYTAAHLAGVFSLADALALVEMRGRLFESLPEGGMLSVSMSADELTALMPSDLSIAAVNGPALAVASGPVRAIEALEQTLQARDVDFVRVRISVAAHSSMLEPILQEFGQFFRRIDMKAPRLPFVSNLSGTWITAAEATDPAYWVRHLRHTVRFAQGLEELVKDDSRILLEVGPGRTLATLARQHPKRAASQPVQSSLRHPDEKVSDLAFMLGVLGRLWAAGATIDWAVFHGGARRIRTRLPTYRFDHQRHWIEASKSASAPAAEPTPTLERRGDMADWFYQQVWQHTPGRDGMPAPARTLVFEDGLGFGARLSGLLRVAGHDVVTVRPGAGYSRQGDMFTVGADVSADHAQMLAALLQEDRAPQRVLHLWTLTGQGADAGDLDTLLRLGFYSLLAFSQAIGSEDLGEAVELSVVTDHLQQVGGESGLMPAKATLLGPCAVIPREFENVQARCVDVLLPAPGSWQEGRLAVAVLAEFGAPATQGVTALRASGRWVQTQEPVKLARRDTASMRERPVVMITGGLGGVGLALAEHLATRQRARLVLLGRTALPARAQWERVLASQGEASATGRRIRQLLALEARGAEVLVVQADVCDAAQMQEAVEQAVSRFGAIHGVLHTAGVLADGVIQLKDVATAASVLAPKVRGTLVLEAALAGQPLDFLVLFSSISSFSGLAGQVDYAAANAFLDAYARDRTARVGSRTVAINWSAWADVGMAAQMARQLGLDQAPAAGDGTPVDHPLIDRCFGGGSAQRSFTTTFSIARHWLLDEHRVRGGDALIPGTGYLEIVRAASAQHARPGVPSLRDVVFLAPFAVGADEQRELRVRFERVDANTESFAVQSPAASGWVDHVRGRVVHREEARPAALPIDALRRQCDLREKVVADGEQPVSLVFGPRWSNLQRVHFGAGQALAALQLPERFAGDLDAMALHPALLDMATAGAQALIPGYDEQRDFFVPASYGSITLFGPLQRTLFSHVRLRGDDTGSHDIASFDVTITDAQGNVLVDVSEFTMMRVRDRALLAAAPRPAASVTAERLGAPAERPHATANHILELGLRDGIRIAEGAQVLERVLGADIGAQVIVSPQDLVALLAQLAAPASTGAAAKSDAPTSAPIKDVTPLEAALAAHAAVREAAASASQGRVVAYVVYNPDQSVTVSELRRHVRGLVPEDLVPQNFIELERLPRLADGAVDRAKLPDPLAVQEAAVGPRNDMERTIAALWQEMLGEDSVGVHDNFFDIGGHSLLSVRFVSRLDKKIGVRLQHEHVVVNTLEQLASKCTQMLEATPSQAEAPAEPAAKGKSLFGAMKQAVLGTRSN